MRWLIEQFVEPSNEVESWNRPETEQADVNEYPARVVVHVGFLFNEPPSFAEMPFAWSSVTSCYDNLRAVTLEGMKMCDRSHLAAVFTILSSGSGSARR